MGYWVYLEEAQVAIPRERKASAFAALKRLTGQFTWVDNKQYVEAETFEEALQALRWRPVQDREGNVFTLEFNGQKLGDDYAVFEALAPFVQAGSTVSIRGEDDQRWTWGFDGRHVRLIEGNAGLSTCTLTAIPNLPASRPPLYPPGASVLQQAHELVEEVISFDETRQRAAWSRAWSSRFSSSGRAILRTIVTLLRDGRRETGERAAQWWLDMLRDQQASADGDVGDLGLMVALDALNERTSFRLMRPTTLVASARACTQNWAERIFDALRSGNVIRLHHLFLLAENICALPHRWVESALQTLLKAFDDPWYELRYVAATALGYLGEQVPLETLEVMLHDTSWERREAAVQVLGRLGKRVSRETLEAALLYEQHPVVREAALAALALRADPDVHELFTYALSDSDHEVRQAAARALNGPGAQLPIAFSQTLMPFSSSVQQTIIAQALGEEERDVLSEEVLQELRERLLPLLAQDTDPYSRTLARRVLGKHLSTTELLERCDTWHAAQLKLAHQIIGCQIAGHLPEPIRALLLDESLWYKHRVVFNFLAAIGQGATLESLGTLISLSDGEVQAQLSLWGLETQDLRMARELLEMWEVTAPAASGPLMTPVQIAGKPLSVDTLRLMGRMGKDAPFEVLIAALTHKQPQIRGTALRSLKELADYVPLDPLLTGLERFDRFLRREVVEILGKRHYRPAIPHLLTFLNSEDVFLRSDAERGLKLLAGFFTVEDLLAVLTSENEGSVVRIIGEIGEHEASLNLLLGILERRVEHVRRSRGEEDISEDTELEEFSVAHDALEALGKLGERAPLEPLLAALHDPNSWVRSGAVEALAKAGPRVPVEALFPLLGDPDQYVRAKVAKALQVLADPKSIDALLPSLADPIYEVREAVVSALRFLSPSVEPAVLLPVLEHRSSSARQAALEVLAAFGERAPVEPILQALADPSVWVRRAAVAALGEVGERAPIEPLLQALRDPSAVLRATAVIALGKMGSRTPIRPLLVALGDRDEYVRQQTLRALLLWHPEAFQDVLLEAEALKQGEEAGYMLGSLAQSQSVRVLGDLVQPTQIALQYLAQALRWPGWQVRFEAVRALAQLEGDLPHEMLNLLLELRHDESQAVCEAAEKALMEIFSREAGIKDD